MADHGEYVVFTIAELQKRQDQVMIYKQVKISSFQDNSCFVLHTLKEYSKITKEKRVLNKLFTSFKTFKWI